QEPGFIRCAVSFAYEGATYRGAGSAGFAPNQIQPTVDHPDDFDSFWDAAKAELAKIPMDEIVTLQPELCTSEIDVYHVNLQNVKMPGSWRGNSRFYGMLSVPKAEGKYPAILAVPGAGIRPYGRDDRAANGVIVLRVGIHGIPVNRDPEVYQSLATGALAGYQNFNLNDPDGYYYKRVYLGCVRAIDYLFTLDKFDGETLAVNGGSQGGALSIVTAGLDDRVKYLAAYYPALSDLTGYVHGRSGGWPHMFDQDLDDATVKRWSKTVSYYDVVNFARRVEVPGWYSWGYNDNVCPPTSMHAAYNVIPGRKEWSPYYETEHWTFPEQREEGNAWLYSQLEVSDN
ncbi:MAG: acetylxylan esterase, partial [Bacteroidota bacterium]